jgi:hypothetical protein
MQAVRGPAPSLGLSLQSTCPTPSSFRISAPVSGSKHCACCQQDQRRVTWQAELCPVRGDSSSANRGLVGRCLYEIHRTGSSVVRDTLFSPLVPKCHPTYGVTAHTTNSTYSVTGPALPMRIFNKSTLAQSIMCRQTSIIQSSKQFEQCMRKVHGIISQSTSATLYEQQTISYLSLTSTYVSQTNTGLISLHSDHR